MAQDAEPIRDLITGPLAELGLLVEEVKPFAAGARRSLTIIVDLAGDTTDPVSSETIVEATRIVSEVLDPAPLFNDHPYTLEVSSPGAFRALTEPRHYRRVLGRTLDITEAGRSGKDAHLHADLLEVDEDGILVKDTKSETTRRLGYGEIDHAQVLLKFR